MNDVDRYLLPTETAVVVVRRHWAFLARDAAILVACQLGALFILSFLGSISLFRIVGVLLLLGSLAWFGFVYSQWWMERFIVTDRRVLLTGGVLSKRVAIMPLTKVTDLTYQRPLLGRLLGYGVFVVESAGQDQALSRVDFLPKPDRVYQDVSMLLFAPKHPVIPQVAAQPTAEPRWVAVQPAIPDRPRWPDAHTKWFDDQDLHRTNPIPPL